VIKRIDLDYIRATESYIETNKENMPESVYSFIHQVCKDEKAYLNLIKEFSEQKGVLKVPDPNAAEY
jgi:hypothetical protein